MSDPQQNNIPDPATTYERAKPSKASPSGKLDLPKPPDPKTPDDLQKHNKAPEEHLDLHKRPKEQE